MPLRVFLVSPHGHCEADAYRDCDRVAFKAVAALRAVEPQMIIGTHLADRLRAHGDYNRPETNATPWRAQMTSLVREARPDIVLEVHSFPGTHPIYARDWPGADLVLYRSPANASWVDRMATLVHEDTGAEVQVVDPTHPVAITDDMRTLGVTHVLVEFNEDGDKDKIAPLAKAVLRAIARLQDQWPEAHGGRDGGSKLDDRLDVALLILLIFALIVGVVLMGSFMLALPYFTTEPI